MSVLATPMSAIRIWNACQLAGIGLAGVVWLIYLAHGDNAGASGVGAGFIIGWLPLQLGFWLSRLVSKSSSEAA